MMPDNIAVMVINLDRATDRLARISTQLERLGMAFTRVAAVDGRTLNPTQQAQFDARAFERQRGMTVWPGEIGCYLSHIEVARRLLAGQASCALVFEDDVLLGDALPDVLRALVTTASRWDMVKLSAVHSGTPVPVLRLTPSHELCVMLSRCTGSSAYLINRRGAQAYLDHLLPMSMPIDHVMDLGWRLGIKVRMVSPPPCTHDEQIRSTIGTPSELPRRKFHWTRRGPAYAYRLRTESRRVVHGLASVWRERRQGSSA
jgi:glycosyl transferase family 25